MALVDSRTVYECESEVDVRIIKRSRRHFAACLINSQRSYDYARSASSQMPSNPLINSVVLMFVAGGLIWINVRGHYVLNVGMMGTIHDRPSTCIGATEEQFMFSDPKYVTWMGTEIYYHGWPCDGIHSAVEFDLDRASKSPEIIKRSRFTQTRYEVQPKGLSIDLVVAFVIIILIWFILEWLIRSRTARTSN